MAALDFTTLDGKALHLFNLPSIPTWQLVVVGGIICWLLFTRATDLTRRLRNYWQPYVIQHVEKGALVVLRIQKWEHPLLDVLLATVASVVSVEFYTAFLPLLFWSGHVRLARQLTLLMALCIYVGNSVKDLVCAPRPPAPPVRRVVPTGAEKIGAQEYGLPSSHTINTICLTGYVLYHLVRHQPSLGSQSIGVTAALLSTIVFLVVYGRLYLGMHSPIDIFAGVGVGTFVLLGWCLLDDYVDAFITGGENVISFWATVALLALFAYPTPESFTPSFEFHTAFNGVAFGISENHPYFCHNRLLKSITLVGGVSSNAFTLWIASGVHRTYSLFHSGSTSAIPINTWAGSMTIVNRLAVGIPTILIIKAASKALAILVLPLVCNLLGVSTRSSSYVPALNNSESQYHSRKEVDDVKKAPADTPRFSSVLKIFQGDEEVMDIDTGIRLVQYTGLGWAVVELAPYVFDYLAL